MWLVMQALFAAYFYPRWDRVNVTWRVKGRWFVVFPGEIPAGSSQTQIVEFCSVKCGWERTLNGGIHHGGGQAGHYFGA